MSAFVHIPAEKKTSLFARRQFSRIQPTVVYSMLRTSCSCKTIRFSLLTPLHNIVVSYYYQSRKKKSVVLRSQTQKKYVHSTGTASHSIMSPIYTRLLGYSYSSLGSAKTSNEVESRRVVIVYSALSRGQSSSLCLFSAFARTLLAKQYVSCQAHVVCLLLMPACVILRHFTRE